MSNRKGYTARKERVVDIEYEDVMGETPDAWQLDMGDGIDKWFPKSISELNEDVNTITVPEWFAKKEELI